MIVTITLLGPIPIWILSAISIWVWTHFHIIIRFVVIIFEGG